MWDLGSTSFQALVCDVRNCTEIHPVSRRRALLNLGLSVGAGGSVPPERVTAAVAAAKRLRRAVDEASPDVITALATAALRDATNGPEVVDRLSKVIGRPVRVLDGVEEARLCFLGQRAGVFMGEGPTMGMDLGGGSFELAVGDPSGIRYATSAPVGATRLRGELGAGDVLGADGRAAVLARTARALAEGSVAEDVSSFPGVARRTVLSGGTARALARVATVRTRESGHESSGDVNQVELPAEQVSAMAAQLATLDLRQRLAVPGMPARRAPMIALGASILDAIAQQLGIERFVVSVWGLREGALLDALARG